ncbi:two-component system heavy metal sensor histidine kinase CusS [Pseudomonas sp. PvR086]|jgi:two-component system heavy metal sensor histidine kinase CusS|uniref:heavy metal sensor histidine kinase n=1 Tax=Pseudomonas TaxID=286 RepID=UPI000B36254D|nr:MULTISPECIES: heavy metal sensor histidine kinase [Pseudomonas]MBD9607778.1 heavy metal sensor histidine kinase [Pseudomonas sp. PDM08]MBD9616491.1 heavy metal sensor histidine kinase [Pseudomonas sp. PDM07]MDR7105879.1 two-component system heavy metal sensor histidine kinase CusS [Pseudomonas frederiksbergensis]PMY50860.1 HAMP domain-containing protein [Pseudomonas sp. FW305-53]PMY85711.1 HAMP domain-containing protein [Pseudomonas sp. FW303-C2]
MKPASLSMRLGLTVSILGALLVVFLAILAYFALTHELNALSRNSLAQKVEQVEHSLSLYADAAEIRSAPHILLDQVMGHDNLTLTIYDRSNLRTPLLKSGSGMADPRLERKAVLAADEPLAFSDGTDDQGKRYLTASRLVRIKDGTRVPVLLSMDDAHNQALLSAYLRSTLIALPLLLIFIGLSAWAAVQRGLMPLREFRKVAAMVSTQDLGHRLSVLDMPQELSELAQGINVMLDRLDNGVQQLSQFSDDLAHELRTPINNLMGKAQVTLSRERTAEAYKNVLVSCTEELERVARIVSDMLFLAQASNPAALTSFESVALEEEVEKVADLFSLSAQDKRISLSVTGSARVLGDRLMIQRAISNLLSNALRHCPAGQTVSLHIEQEATQVALEVSNPGAGIEAQHLPHLFDRFYRVDSSRSRSQGSTGLGLAIVRSIMSLHQGVAQVKSSPGTLTVFRLGFPTPDE